jgi:hypothetical protein
MTEGRGEQTEPEQRLTVPEAADTLGVTSEAVRTRIHRGTLRSVREGGRVFVLLDADRTQPNIDRTDDQTQLVEALQDQVDYLRQELKIRTEENRRKDHLLAAALERIPALEPPGDPESAAEPVATTETPPEPAEQKPHKEESSPPQGQDSSDSTLREGAQQGHLVAPRPRWAQIGVAVLLAAMITTIPQLIWWLATRGLFPSPLFVYGFLHTLVVLCGLWAGLAWPGRHPKGLAVLGAFAGLLDLAINWSIFHFLRPVWSAIGRIDLLSAIAIVALFTAGGLFGDLIESWRSPRKREEESEVVRGIAQQASRPRKQPSETTLKLVQALGPSILALIGLIIGLIAQKPQK